MTIEFINTIYHTNIQETRFIERIDCIILNKGLYSSEDLSPKTDGSAGIDLKANIYSPHFLWPGEKVLIPTGLKLAIPDHLTGLLFPRSSGWRNRTLANAVGVIDSDYRGEIKAAIWNHSNEPIDIIYGERVGQLVFIPKVYAELNPVETLPETDRGEGGFGSTGK